MNISLKHLPNILTVSRAIAGIVVPLLLIEERAEPRFIAFVVFTFAAITDWIDGYLARRMIGLSVLGRMLDPVADKLLIGGTLLALVSVNNAGIPVMIPALAILLRELFVSGLREFSAENNFTLNVTRLAKYKTTFQFIALGLVIIFPLYRDQPYLYEITVAGLYITTLLTLVTGTDYFIKAYRHVG